MLMLSLHEAFATGEPSTYFQIFVPPNNDAVRRDAALIVTAIYDSTYFEIIDDGADGDTDDSKSGMLMAGQSYVLYIRDNGINDDARYASGGVLKWDGDYFIVKGSKLVYASQSTNSDWQHDWVPSTDKSSIGKKFIIYSPSYSSSKRDVNVFAYEPNTTISFQKISTQPKINSGFTDVNFENPVNIFTRTINPGEDLIYKYINGRDVMDAGETYVIIADKAVTVQYGALYGNERDGGGYVPSSNGSSSGEQFYFAVPYQSAGEQEIRIVSWDNSNAVQLDRYVNGNWVAVKSFTLNQMKAGDWVGKNDGNVSYATAFRLTCTAGKRVSVFEGNWFETGSPGTSDMATMVSSETGTTAGKKFLTYMAPPGSENNVINPFTNQAFGQQLTHLYIFSKPGATVTVKDAYSNGQKFSRTYTIAAERYIDCALTLAEWKSIYNGTGTNSGPERPYLLVEASNTIAVMNTNFNDNWMLYTGSSLSQSFTSSSDATQNNAIPGDTLSVEGTINIGSTVTDSKIEVVVQDGLKVIESVLETPVDSVKGRICNYPAKTVVVFDSLRTLQQYNRYKVRTKVVTTACNNTGSILNGQSNVTVETVVSGKVDGQQQESVSTEVININTSNTSKLIFSRFNDNLFSKDSTDSWTISWVDINKDGYDDIFTTDRRSNKPNLIYLNNKTGGFTRGQSLVADSAISMSSSWADIDNDGDEDLLVMNNTRKANSFYRNDNGLLVKDNSKNFAQTVAYYHGGAFSDFDNDGKVDLFLCNYFPTKYNELYRNANNGAFVKDMTNLISTEANQSIGPSWADYDGDGFQDLFVPNGNGYKNSLFHNEGNGNFSKTTTIISNEGGQSVGSCWGDIDNDGDLDLFVANSNGLGNFMYLNEGNGNFSRVTKGTVVTGKVAAHGCSFADIDNDGDLDLYITNDRNFRRLYINDGTGNFNANENEIITFNIGNSFGHAWSDFDHDGDLDLAIATHSGQPNILFTNNGNPNKWIEIKLVGTVSNTSSIGADIFVLSNGVTQMREVNSQSGFGGQSSLIQHFGLGDAGSITTITIKWPSGEIQTLSNVSCNQILTVTEPLATKISGGVYFDANGNCTKDEGEELVGRAVLKFEDGKTRLFTNESGYFSTSLLPGSYQLQLVDDDKMVASCAEPIQFTVTTTADSIWVGARSLCSGTDASVIMGGTAIRKGFTNNNFTIVVSNNGRKTISNPAVKLQMPATINVLGPNIIPAATESVIENNITNKIYTWYPGTLEPFSSKLISFTHGNASTVNIGDSIVFKSWISSSDMDCNESNNSQKQVYKVVGAIDPNDLAVVPLGYGEEGYIMPTQLLTYTIRFQNTGTHAAERISITDRLPEGLDMNSIQVIATSHKGFQLSINGNEANFILENAFLPDSSSNQEGSEGYISFAIKPKEGIAGGTRLINRAFIQFDHYEAVETNEVLNTIQTSMQEQEMIEVKTYPNPAADVIYFSLRHKMGEAFTNREINKVTMFDLSGRPMFTKKFSPKEEWRVDLPVWLNGFYLMKIEDSQGRSYTTKIYVRKTR